jgi:AcrR family transcriptional regulator
MPAKTTISRAQVLDAAFALVRRGGLGALSARAVGREIGCSTQPIYSAYGSMKALAAEVLARVQQVALGYLLPPDGADSTEPFLQVGLGSLRFARDEPQLYAAFARSGPFLRDLQKGKPPPPFVLKRMRADPLLGRLSDEQLTRINALMWFFSQGLGTLFVAELSGDPFPLAERYLRLAGEAVVTFETKHRRES